MAQHPDLGALKKPKKVKVGKLPPSRVGMASTTRNLKARLKKRREDIARTGHN